MLPMVLAYQNKIETVADANVKLSINLIVRILRAGTRFHKP